jgi:putative dehydrogenase
VTEGATRCIGIVSTGAMGAPVGRALVGRSHRVVVALDGRSERSATRAVRAGLEDLGTLEALVGAADLVVSIVPPGAAVEVAEKVAQVIAEGAARPTFLDANAISPTRADQIARTIEGAGGRYVDGGIVGGPPGHGQRTDLFVPVAHRKRLPRS